MRIKRKVLIGSGISTVALLVLFIHTDKPFDRLFYSDTRQCQHGTTDSHLPKTIKSTRAFSIFSNIAMDEDIKVTDEQANLVVLDDTVKNTILDEDLTKAVLLEGLIPANIHYMWCGKRWFEFKHYLSFMSAIQTFKPNNIVFHYEFLPFMDMYFYNRWFEDLKRDFPYLILEPMNAEVTKYCYTSDREQNINTILKLLNQEGGIYISENTWVINSPPEDRLVDFEMTLEHNTLDGYIIMRAGMFQTGSITQHNLLHNRTFNSKIRSCSPIHQIHNSKTYANCYIVKGPKFDRFYPMDIWELENSFGRLCRQIFYGTETILKPKPSYKSLVPNIGHMVWVGNGRMDFVFYLSMLSMLYVAKVDILYLHGDEPIGPYWEKICSIERIRKQIKLIKRVPPPWIYQSKVDMDYRALVSDIIRIEVMIQYGGLYNDMDAIWIKPLSQEERAFDAVACYDWVDWTYPYPDSVNFGVMYGKRNAPFWKLFRDSMRDLHNKLYGFNGVLNPYKILEKEPTLLKIDKRLSVICYFSKCHPIWVNNYHNESNNHETTNSIPNWREDVHAFHWTHPNPVEFANESMLLSSTGVFAEIGQFVLKSAGLI